MYGAFRMTGWTRLLAIGVCVALCVGAGCGGGTPSSTTPSRSLSRTVPGQASIAVSTDRFPHDKHTGSRPEIKNWQGRGLGCKDCHAVGDVTAGVPARAGGKPGDPS